ncbi:MAG: NAD(P)-dependent oxidoreductase, partial [Treponema sp.]|nr:NAD(P)-dependent oxidoreductase [Treponema sp.]
IRHFAIERLLKNSNAPMNWVKTNKEGRIDAFFGGRKALEELPKTWDKYPVLSKGQTPEGNVDYTELKDESKAGRFFLNHGYDETKPDSELGLSDMKEAAAFRGGSVESKSMKKGDLYTRLEWKCHNGHVFASRPFTVIKAGFWCPECCEAPNWSFDKASVHVPFYAQVWYDSHRKDEENNVYPYSEHEDDDLLLPVEKL